MKTLIRKFLTTRWLPLLLAVIAMTLTLPALWSGWLREDYIHRLIFSGKNFAPVDDASLFGLFSFLNGDPARNFELMDRGVIPWWSYDQLRISFWRILTELTHWLDYQLWPDSPLLIHLHSLLWLGATVAVVTLLYRLIGGVGAATGLAALMFALEDAHGFPVAWIANRNALVATFFGISSLLCYIRWRQQNWRPGAFLAPALLGLGLLAGEVASATGGYLLAYALVLERGAYQQRLLRLLPCLLILLIWKVSYSLLGFGVVGSEVYVDPTHNPLRFLTAVGERAPILLLGQLGFPPADIYHFLSSSDARQFWIAAVVFLLILNMALIFVLKKDPIALFWGVGMYLAIIPSCAVHAQDRTLFMAGVGAFGLLAQFFKYCLGSAEFKIQNFAVRLPLLLLTILLLLSHLVVAPLLTPARSFSSRFYYNPTYLPFILKGIDRDAMVILINQPFNDIATYYHIITQLNHPNAPKYFRALSSGTSPVTIERTDSYTIKLTPRNGFLSDYYDKLFRSSSLPMRNGETIKLTGLTIKVMSLTHDQRPLSVAFRFTESLENKNLQFYQWSDDKLIPFKLPLVGESKIANQI